MAEDLMRYDLMAQEALRGVMRSALLKVEKEGLPGDHHFYIEFNTQMPGVRLSDRLLERYPEVMTIVMQHQFWGLEIAQTHFILELSFDNIPEKLTIPFSAVKGFYDPSVQFGLQFESTQANENVEYSDAIAQSEAVSAGAPSGLLPEPVLDHTSAGDTVPADNSNIVKLDAFRRD
jgi:uncharacterized protein